jgi:hypothetical protein
MVGVDRQYTETASAVLSSEIGAFRIASPTACTVSCPSTTRPEPQRNAPQSLAPSGAPRSQEELPSATLFARHATSRGFRHKLAKNAVWLSSPASELIRH